MSGFTTFNAAGFGAGGATGNVAFNYDPLYTSSVPTQNIPSGTTATSFIPGSFNLNGSSALQIQNPAAPNPSFNFPVAPAFNRRITSLNGAGDFTVECWYYPTSNTFGSLISASLNNGVENDQWSLAVQALGQSGSVGWWYNGNYTAATGVNAIKLNTWNHIAYVRSGTTGTLFVNGVSVASGADANNYRTDFTNMYLGRWNNIAEYLNGFLSQPRITLSAVYPGTVSFIPNPNLGVLPNTTFYAPALSSASVGSDLSPSGQTISAFAGTMTYSAFAPAASTGSGMFIPDTTSGITANSAAFTFGTGPFTAEYWVNFPYSTSSVQQLLAVCNLRDFVNVPATGSGYAVNSVSPAVNLLNYVPYVLSPNSWNHLAFSRNSSNVLTAWVNGQPVATGSNSASYTGNLDFNRGGVPGSNVVVGPIRISNTAVYTANTAFSPPTTFANTGNTVFLLQGGGNLSTYLTDRSVNAIPVSAIGNLASSINRVDYNISGNVVGDISGARNTGLVLRASGTGNATGVVFDNNYGGYWQFNGNTTNSAIISTGQVANSQSSFSQSVWFQTSSANGILTMLQNNISPATSGSLLNGLVVNATGRLSFYTSLTVAFPAQGNIATANVLDNKWHHAAVTYDSVTKTANTYLDGQLGNTLALGGANNIVFFSGYYAIGGASQGIAAGVGNAFRGNIGPAAVYSSTLTANQISQIYSTQVSRFYPTAPTPGTAYYTYRDGSVQTFTVPPFVTELNATVIGAAGGTGLTLAGASSSALGGAGANISATLAVTPGQTLFLVVGQGGFSNVQTAGTISQGGGGAAGPYYAGTGQIPGSSGGGFTGIFSADPSTAANAVAAQATAMLIAGGGGGGTGGGNLILIGGNASSTLSGNSRAGIGSAGVASTNALVTVANVISNGTTVTINLSGGAAGNAVNFSIGCPVSVVNGTFANTFIGNVRTANTTAITAVYGGGTAVPVAGTYTGTLAYAGGFNGANVQAYNGQGGGWATQTEGGWQGVVSAIAYANNSARTMPTAGSALQGGTGGAGNQIFSTAATGAGGGGGWYGGGGGSFGSPATGSGAAGSGGGGSNFANSQIVIANTVSYGTLTTNTGVTRINGNIFLSWNTSNITANDVELNIVPNNTFSYPGTGNTVFDLSPNFNNGTLGNVTYTSPAFNFNGANSFISVADSATLEPGSGDWTMEAWFNADTVVGTHNVLTKTNNGGLSSNLSYAIRMVGANVFGEFGNGTTSFNATGMPFTANTWNHVVVSYQNISQKSITSYLNGQQQAQVTHSFSSILDTTRPLSIGSYNLNEFAQQFSGQIGIVKLYDYALNSGEVLASYNATRGIYGV